MNVKVAISYLLLYFGIIVLGTSVLFIFFVPPTVEYYSGALFIVALGLVMIIPGFKLFDGSVKYRDTGGFSEMQYSLLLLQVASKLKQDSKWLTYGSVLASGMLGGFGLIALSLAFEGEFTMYGAAIGILFVDVIVLVLGLRLREKYKIMEAVLTPLEALTKKVDSGKFEEQSAN